MDLKKLAALAKLQRAAEAEEANDEKEKIPEELNNSTEETEIFIPIDEESESVSDDNPYDKIPADSQAAPETLESIISRCFDEKAYNIELERLLPFHTEIFSDDSDDISELKSDIARVGITEPLLVRSVGNGEYEILSGNRRRIAAEHLMWTKVPCRIGGNNEITEELAKRIVVETNRQRFHNLKLSEQIRVSDVLGDTAAQELNITPEQAQEYIALNHLEQPFLKMIDNGEINIAIAKMLAVINNDTQQQILNTLTQHPEMKITAANAKELSSESTLTAAAIAKILKPKPPVKVAVPAEVIAEYLADKNAEELTEIVTAAIVKYGKEKHNGKI